MDCPMTLDEIFTEWEHDAAIDMTELAREIVRIPKLHVKYGRWHDEEKLKLRGMEEEFKVLYLEKFKFYKNGPTEDQRKRGWEYPRDAKGTILKSDIPMHMDADPQVRKAVLLIENQKTKVERLEKIMWELKERSRGLCKCVDYKRFLEGG